MSKSFDDALFAAFVAGVLFEGDWEDDLEEAIENYKSEPHRLQVEERAAFNSAYENFRRTYANITGAEVAVGDEPASDEDGSEAVAGTEASLCRCSASPRAHVYTPRWCADAFSTPTWHA